MRLPAPMLAARLLARLTLAPLQHLHLLQHLRPPPRS